MRVLFVYQFVTIGGVETVLRARLTELPRHGIDAEVWFLADYGGMSVFEGLEDKVHVGSVSALAQHLDEAPGYDVVSSIDTPQVFEVLSARRARHRLVVECHTPYVENQGYLKDVDSSVADVVLVPTEHQAEVTRRRLRAAVPVRVVPNPLHDSFTEPAPAEVPAPARPAVLWVGRMDELKNWRGFLDLGHALMPLAPEAELWLVGKPVQPELVQQLYKTAKALGIMPRLRWWSGLPHARLPALIDLARASGGALVSTSKGESFGMTLAEAMARGCPVAAPATTPFTEFVEHDRTGVLYRSGSMTDAAAAVARLLNDPARAALLGQAGREAVLGRFAPGPATASLAAELQPT